MFYNFLLSLDILSSKISIYGNKKSKRIQTYIGGLISLLATTIIGAAILWFTYKFFSYDKPLVILDSQFDEEIKFKNFQNLPFIIRLSDDIQRPFNETEKYYTPIFVWITTAWENGIIVQKYNTTNMVRCDINRHFGEYKELFKDTPALDSYFCHDKNNETMNIEALYGGSKLFSFGYLAITQCNTIAANNKCHSQAKIDFDFVNIYIDILTLDYIITKNIKPAVPTIYSIRTTVNNRSTKRIWLGLKSIIYETDFGIIFEKKELNTFHQIVEYRHDLNLKDKKDLEIGKAGMVTISIQNDKYVSLYFRSYTKAQEFFASLGGIIKALLLVSQLFIEIFGRKIAILNILNNSPQLTIMYENTLKDINFNNEKKSDFAKIKLVNSNNSSYIAINKSVDENIIKTKNNNQSIALNNYTKNNNNLKSEIEEVKLERKQTKHLLIFNEKFSENIYKKIRLELLDHLLPFNCWKKTVDYKRYTTGKKNLEEILNVKSLISTQIEHYFLKKIVLAEKELNCFNHYFSSSNFWEIKPKREVTEEMEKLNKYYYYTINNNNNNEIHNLSENEKRMVDIFKLIRY